MSTMNCYEGRALRDNILNRKEMAQAKFPHICCQRIPFIPNETKRVRSLQPFHPHDSEIWPLMSSTSLKGVLHTLLEGISRGMGALRQAWEGLQVESVRPMVQDRTPAGRLVGLEDTEGLEDLIDGLQEKHH